MNVGWTGRGEVLAHGSHSSAAADADADADAADAYLKVKEEPKKWAHTNLHSDPIGSSCSATIP